MPYNMEIAQVITVVDGSTFPVYLNNMRSILSNLFLNSEMVMFNRCTEEMDLQSYRRTVRGLNPRAMGYFEDEEGNLDFAPEDDYYGEVDFRMQYKQVKGDPFDWIYIDLCTLSLQAAQAGFQAEKIAEGEHFDYLARLTLK